MGRLVFVPDFLLDAGRGHEKRRRRSIRTAEASVHWCWTSRSCPVGFHAPASFRNIFPPDPNERGLSGNPRTCGTSRVVLLYQIRPAYYCGNPISYFN